MTTTNYTNLIATIDWLYGMGHAERIAYFKRGELLEVSEPSALRLFEGLVRIFDDSTLEELPLTWLVWDSEAHRYARRDVTIYRSGTASIAA